MTSRAVRDDAPGTWATVLLGAAGLAGVLVGSTLDAPLGTVVMAASAVVPAGVLGGALARSRAALAHEGRQRRRLAGEVAASDEQARRLADRVDLLADQGLDDAAELERSRRQLRRARVELATSRALLCGLREDDARASATVEEAATASDGGRTRADLAVAQVAQVTAAAAAAQLALEADRTATGEATGWRPAARAVGQRSFASVDLRVFDAYTEADLADEDAVLDAPVRRGRHVAPLDPAPVADPVRGAVTAAVTPVLRSLPRDARESDVA